MSKQSSSNLVGVAGLALMAALAGCSPKPSSTTPPPAGSGAPSRPAALTVTDVALGRSIGVDKSISDRSNSFSAADTIYVSILTAGGTGPAALTARWTYEDGQVVEETTQSVASGGGPIRAEFHVSKADGWPPGAYKVTVLVNGIEAAHRDFRVS